MGILSNGPKATETLNDREYGHLVEVLKLSRREKQEPYWFHNFLDQLEVRNYVLDKNPSEKLAPHHILDSTLSAWNQSQLGEDLGTIVFDPRHRDVIGLSESETVAVMSFICILRSEHWLESFLRMTVNAFSEGRRHTPREVIGNLIEEASNFDINAEAARAMLTDYPELFTAAIERLAPKPAELQTELKGQETGARKPRKSGKKAA